MTPPPQTRLEAPVHASHESNQHTLSLLFILSCLPHQIPSSLRAGLVYSAYLSNLELGRASTERSLVKYWEGASLVAQMVKRLPAMRETWVWSLGWEDPLNKEMALHSSILAWRIPWTEDPGRLQSMQSQRVRHDWATSLPFFLIQSFT